MFENMEKMIQKKLVEGYGMEKGLAAAAAKEIVDELAAEHEITRRPYLDDKPTSVFDFMAQITRAHIIKDHHFGVDE